jgi:hypothetical protein
MHKRCQEVVQRCYLSRERPTKMHASEPRQVVLGMQEGSRRVARPCPGKVPGQNRQRRRPKPDSGVRAKSNELLTGSPIGFRLSAL